MERKFLVLKIEDIQSALSNEEQATLENFCTRIAMERVKRNKTARPDYLVVNEDEPYASNVKYMILFGNRLRKEGKE